MKNYKYSYHVIPIGENGDEAYTAVVPKFKNMHVFGGSLKELHEGIMIGIEFEIEQLKKAGKPIPPEDKKSKFNGKVLLRIPVELHQKLHFEAKAGGVSLNRYIQEKLV